MDLRLLVLACFYVSSSLGVDSKESNSRVPLVKHGTSSNLLNVLQSGQSQMLGIIGGLPTNISDHPYQVAIDYGKTFVCAGALLNRIWALTLASCAEGAAASDLTVRISSDSNVHGGTVVNVSEIVVHPNYNYTTMDYDFALLKFNTYICFDPFTNSVGFATRKPPSYVQATISGWGSRKKGTFYQLKMRIVTHQTCQLKYTKSRDIITSRMFCATAGSKGPCQNDFGDPLVVNGTLYGLFSWSRGCANSNYPAVFSNLASVKDWIYTTMNNACTCGIY